MIQKIRVFGPALLLLLLAGCGATTQSASLKEQKTEPIAKIEKSKAFVAPLPENTIKIEPVEEEGPEKLKAIPAPRKPIPEVTVLMGKTAEEIEQVFGRPILQRKDKPAEVWQYLTDECALHLVFYPAKEKAASALTVQYVSMNDRKKAIAANSVKCFGSQLRGVGEDRVQALG